MGVSPLNSQRGGTWGEARLNMHDQKPQRSHERQRQARAVAALSSSVTPKTKRTNTKQRRTSKAVRVEKRGIAIWLIGPTLRKSKKVPKRHGGVTTKKLSVNNSTNRKK